MLSSAASINGEIMGFTVHPNIRRALHQPLPLQDSKFHETVSSGERQCFKWGDIGISKLKCRFLLDALEKPKLPVTARVWHTHNTYIYQNRLQYFQPLCVKEVLYWLSVSNPERRENLHGDLWWWELQSLWRTFSRPARIVPWRWLVPGLPAVLRQPQAVSVLTAVILE